MASCCDEEGTGVDSEEKTAWSWEEEGRSMVGEGAGDRP
jgi:hypothetical protein